MAKYGSSKIKGHGIPEAMEAVLFNRSRIQPRVAILKPISAAIAIGTGGPFGAEGPIIQTGGAVGSLVGQLFHTTGSERKVLLACGAAAGMSATFNTPIAGVILAIELLLFEFKSRSFIPLVIASTLATAVHMQLLGAGPMFTVKAMDFGIPHALPFYLLLGLICGVAAVGFSRLLYWTEDQFDKLPIDQLWWPAIGALGLGIIGYFVPRVLGVGYDTISDILNGSLALKLLLIVMAAKAIALVVSLGSGTSGGLLAPMFMSSARGFCAGRNGRGFWSGRAGHIYFHHLRLRDHPRLQLGAASDAGKRYCRRRGYVAGA
jgi:H+/Cl- antiporter ClcA